MVETDRMLIEITYDVLDLAKLYHFVLAEPCGAVDIFIGTVRNHAEGRGVSGIEYHGYPEMGEVVLREIVANALRHWPIHRVALQHRLGTLSLKEASVIIAVSCAHRAEAFEACRFIIEEIKKEVPVWKKEHFTNGEAEWKEAAPHK